MIRMSPPLRSALFLVVVLLIACPGTAAFSLEGEFGRVTPDEAGWSAEALDAAGAYADSAGYAAVVLAHAGDVFYEWGDVNGRYKLHSVRKPMMSALYGIHVTSGEIDLDATLAELGVTDSPIAPTEEELRATVRTLLQARSGVYIEAAAESQSMKDSRPERGSHAPGEHFYYNNWGFNVAGTIFREETGKDIFEAFAEEVAGPIGMEDFRPEECFYWHQEDISLHPAYHFRMTARDLARFGVLYLNEGIWEGREVVPREWVMESTSIPAEFGEDPLYGYGYMWAIIPEGSPAAGALGPRWYGHAGSGGHFLAVFPDLEFVLVFRVDTDADPAGVPDEKGIVLLRMIMDARVETDTTE
jgi:CubicO group peptidase (beta-lactamase class C family)